MGRVIKDIARGGMGGDALVMVQTRNFFPGIGGPIMTKQTSYVALRQEQKSASVSGAGHRTFLRHMVIKKIDDFFCRNQTYLSPHITRPFGSTCLDNALEPFEASIYEWVWGQDGFPWEITDEFGETSPVLLEEWGTFKEVFSNAGIDLSEDIADIENGRISQNIVHQLLGWGDVNSGELNSCWHRIDFGPDSVFINYEKLECFLKDNKENLKLLLGSYRYELLLLSYKVLSPYISMTEKEMGHLEILVREFRKSSLRHLDPESVL